MKKEKKHRFSLAKGIGLAALFGILVGGGISGTMLFRSHLKNQENERAMTEKKEETERKEQENKATELSIDSGTEDSNAPVSVLDVSPVWTNAVPAVVEINTKNVSTYRFFGQEYEEEAKGSGTGIILAQGEELYIVTNFHVIDGATEIETVFVDGTTAKAEIKGTNEKKDIAVLTVPFSEISEETQKKIRIASVGDSKKLACGEMVVAIGNANGEGQSLTVGYVSAVDREVEIDGLKMNVIQTDAAINPGNSGGPLLRADGSLIGINNAKLVSTSVEGIGYAIPISEVLSEISQLMNREEVTYKQSAVLGIKTTRDVTESLSEILNIPVGVYVMEYTENSPMEKAGIPIYSVITMVNGVTVESEEELTEALSYIRGGTDGTVTVEERIRGKYEAKEYTVHFGVREDFEK